MLRESKTNIEGMVVTETNESVGAGMAPPITLSSDHMLAPTVVMLRLGSTPSPNHGRSHRPQGGDYGKLRLGHDAPVEMWNKPHDNVRWRRTLATPAVGKLWQLLQYRNYATSPTCHPNWRSVTSVVLELNRL